MKSQGGLDIPRDTKQNTKIQANGKSESKYPAAKPMALQMRVKPSVVATRNTS